MYVTDVRMTLSYGIVTSEMGGRHVPRHCGYLVESCQGH